MNRSVVLTIAAVGLFAIGVLAANTRIAQSVIPVGPYEADINKDARINSIDQLHLAKNYGLPVPTATPIAAPTPAGLTDRANAVGSFGVDKCCALIDTNDGSIVATFNSRILGVSCDGRRGYLDETDATGVFRTLSFIDMETGTILATSAPFPNSGSQALVLFSCPAIPGGVSERVVVELQNPSLPTGRTLTIWNLATGQVVFADNIEDAPVKLDCSRSIVIFRDSPMYTLMNLVDGSSSEVEATQLDVAFCPWAAGIFY